MESGELGGAQLGALGSAPPKPVQSKSPFFSPRPQGGRSLTRAAGGWPAAVLRRRMKDWPQDTPPVSVSAALGAGRTTIGEQQKNVAGASGFVPSEKPISWSIRRPALGRPAGSEIN